LSSTIGLKFIVGITGAGMFAFTLVHMLGHLQMFAGPDAYNTYAATLQGLGALKWLARAGLLAMIALHVWGTVTLTARNRAARPEAYQKDRKVEASLASRTMIYSGLFLACFVLFHLAHFTLGWTHPDEFALQDQLGRHDVYAGMVLAFQSPLMSLFYMVAVALLCFHLSHGVSSLFRSLGLMSPRFRKLEEQFAIVSAWSIFLGFVSVPVAILVGVIR
jgi:succinate dehydrogenase / fumarate reductase cytochrome b subunit